MEVRFLIRNSCYKFFKTVLRCLFTCFWITLSTFTLLVTSDRGFITKPLDTYLMTLMYGMPLDRDSWNEEIEEDLRFLVTETSGILLVSFILLATFLIVIEIPRRKSHQFNLVVLAIRAAIAFFGMSFAHSQWNHLSIYSEDKVDKAILAWMLTLTASLLPWRSLLDEIRGYKLVSTLFHRITVDKPELEV